MPLVLPGLRDAVTGWPEFPELRVYRQVRMACVLIDSIDNPRGVSKPREELGYARHLHDVRAEFRRGDPVKTHGPP